MYVHPLYDFRNVWRPINHEEKKMTENLVRIVARLSPTLHDTARTGNDPTGVKHNGITII